MSWNQVARPFDKIEMTHVRIRRQPACPLEKSASVHSGKKNVERIRIIPSHGVAALSAFGIEGGNPFRDCIDNLLIDLEG